MRKSAVAVAVAAALGSASGVALGATGFTPAQAAAPHASIWIGGSSAAANGVISFIETSVCGGNPWNEWDTDTAVVGSPDFRAVTCVVPNNTFIAESGNQITFYYRPEGGSVIGVYAIFNGSSISYPNLNASDGTYSHTYNANGGLSLNSHNFCDPNASLVANVKLVCNGGNTYINVLSSTADGGAAGTVGGDDAWGTSSVHSNPMLSHTLDVGVADAEPALFGDASSPTAYGGAGNNDPANYASAGAGNPLVYSFVGNTITVDSLLTMTASRILQQTFGFIVNTTGAAAPTDLPRDSIAALFAHAPGIQSTIGGNAGEPDWGKVALANGNRVAALGTQAIICNREVGSGTRTTADLFLTQDGCDTIGAQPALFDYAINLVAAQPANNFATSLELDCVNRNANSIGYVSVDNLSKIGAGHTYPNVALITVNGVTASNLNSATEQYGYNYEMWITENTATPASADGKALYTALIPKLQALATTAQSAQNNAIPGIGGNVTAYPPTPQGVVFQADYSRGGNSCTTPQKQ